MAALLILPLILHAILAGTDVQLPSTGVREQCLLGPEVWCESEKAAFLCMKEDYCAELWNNSPAEVFDSGTGHHEVVVPPSELGSRKQMRNGLGEGSMWWHGPIQCKVCKAILNVLTSTLRNNSAKSTEKIHGALRLVCNRVPSLLRGTCHSVVRKFSGQIINAIKQHVKPDSFCVFIKVCKRSAGTHVRSRSPGVPEQCLQGPEVWCESEEVAFLCMKEDYCEELWEKSPAEVFDSGTGDEAVKPPPEERWGRHVKGKKRGRKGGKKKHFGGFKCTACKKIIKKLTSSIDDNQSDEDIGSALDSICDNVFVFLRGICRTVVDQYRDEIIEAIKENLDPATLCAQIQMCSESAECDEEVDSVELSEQCLQGPGFWCQSEETASLCMKEDYCTELQLNSTLEQLEASGQGELEDSTEKKKKDKKKKKKDKKKKPKYKKKDEKCSACTQIIKNLQQAAGEDPDEDAINTLLESMCDDVDDSISQVCSIMQVNNKDDLREAIKNSENPIDVCSQIQMCGGRGLGESQVPMVSDPTTTKTCTICQVFTSLVKPKLIDGSLGMDLERVLADACQDHFGNSTACKNFLLAFGAKMKHVLPKPWDHVTTCLEIKACEVGVQPAVPGSADACQEGPASWCQSVESALQCNTLSYCIKAWRI